MSVFTKTKKIKAKKVKIKFSKNFKHKKTTKIYLKSLVTKINNIFGGRPKLAQILLFDFD